jgi:inosose dehydratase
MSAIQFGCQFYTWQMSGQRYVGELPHITGVVRAAGFSGIEPETGMLGRYYADPLLLKDVLAERGLALGALTLVPDWKEPQETEAERQEAERVFDYLRAFPGTLLVLVQMPGADRADLRQRQQNALACINAVAARAAARGIVCAYHPNSPPGSLFRTLEDYQRLLDGLDPRVCGFAPDTGHVAKGGIDVSWLFETYRPLIRHVHFKDMTAGDEWAAMGAGVIDFPRLVTRLRDTGYQGWIMVEEESAAAETDPDTATLNNGEYLRQSLLPLV